MPNKQRLEVSAKLTQLACYDTPHRIRVFCGRKLAVVSALKDGVNGNDTLTVSLRCGAVLRRRDVWSATWHLIPNARCRGLLLSQLPVVSKVEIVFPKKNGSRKQG